MMSEWRIEFQRSSLKDIKKFDRKVQKRIFDYLEEWVIQSQKPRLQGKALKGEYTGLWRYRVGNYRIICDIQVECLVVLVVQIIHRKKDYRAH